MTGTIQPSAYAQQPTGPTNDRLKQTQAQIDEVVGIMKINMEKVLERDQNLAQLDHRADALHLGAAQFEKSAVALKRKYWWSNIKMIVMLCTLVFILFLIVFIWTKV